MNSIKIKEKIDQSWSETEALLGDFYKLSISKLKDYANTSGEKLFLFLLGNEKSIKSIQKNENYRFVYLDLARNCPKDELEKFHLIISKFVEIANSKGVNLPDYGSPTVIKNDKPKITKDNQGDLAISNAYRVAIKNSYDLELNSEAKVGQLLAASIAFGGLNHQSLIAAFLKVIHLNPSYQGGVAYYDLVPKWGKFEDIGLYRWFLPLEVELLLMQVRIDEEVVYNESETTLNNRVLKLLKFFFKSINNKELVPNSISSFLNSMNMMNYLDFCPVIYGYQSRSFLSFSTDSNAYSRSFESTLKIPDLNKWQVKDPLPLIDLELEKYLDVKYPWLEFVKNDFNDADDIDKILSSLEKNSIKYYLYSWAKVLIERYQAKTIRGYMNSLGKRIYEALLEEDINKLDSTGLESLYDDVIDDIDSRSLKIFISKVAHQFHQFLVKEYGFPEISNCKIFDNLNRPLPVDANLIWLEEYNLALDILDKSDLVSLHPDLVSTAKLLTIFGYKLGLRRREALGLRLCDVSGLIDLVIKIRAHEERGLKTNNAKRNLPGKVLLDEEECNLLVSFYKKRLAQEDESKFSQYLFAVPGLNYKLVPEQFIFPIIHTALRAATSDQTIRYHHLRHSFASFKICQFMSINHDLAFPMLSTHPKTQRWLVDCKNLYLGFYNSTEPTRKHFYQIAALMGHSSPETTIYHYIHTLDMISYELRLKNSNSSKKELAALSKLPTSTAYRILSSNGISGVIKKVRKQNGIHIEEHNWNKPKFDELIDFKSSDFGHRRINTSIKILRLFVSGKLSIEDLISRYKDLDIDIQELLERSKNLAAFYSNNSSHSRKFESYEFNGSHYAIAKTPRLYSERKEADRFSDELIKLKLYDSERANALFDLYFNNSWRTKYLAVFRNPDKAYQFLKILIKLGIYKKDLSLTVLCAKDEPILSKRKSKKHWEMEMKEYSRYILDCGIASSGRSLGEIGRLGINIIGESGKASMAYRYVLNMALILFYE